MPNETVAMKFYAQNPYLLLKETIIAMNTLLGSLSPFTDLFDEELTIETISSQHAIRFCNFFEVCINTKNPAYRLAAYGLGLMYHYALGVAPDLAKAKASYLLALSIGQAEPYYPAWVTLGQLYEQQHQVREAFDAYSYAASRQLVAGYYYFAQYCHVLLIIMCEEKELELKQHIKQHLLAEYSINQLYNIAAKNYFLVSEQSAVDPALAIHAQQNLQALRQHSEQNVEINILYNQYAVKAKEKRLQDSATIIEQPPRLTATQYVIIRIWRAKKEKQPISTLTAIAQSESETVNIGHASAQLVSHNDNYYVSHWPGAEMDGPSKVVRAQPFRTLTEDIESENSQPDQYIILFSLDVDSMIKQYRQTCAADYSLITSKSKASYNCSTRVLDLLKVGGLFSLDAALRQPLFITPNTLFSFISQVKIAELTRFPETATLQTQLASQLLQELLDCSQQGPFELKQFFIHYPDYQCLLRYVSCPNLPQVIDNLEQAVSQQLLDCVQKNKTGGNIISELIKRGAHLNVCSENGYTALHWAVHHKRLDLVAVLIKKFPWAIQFSSANKAIITPLALAEEQDSRIAQLMKVAIKAYDFYEKGDIEEVINATLSTLPLQTKNTTTNNNNNNDNEDTNLTLSQTTTLNNTQHTTLLVSTQKDSKMMPSPKTPLPAAHADKNGNTPLHCAVEIYHYANILENYKNALLVFHDYPSVNVNAQNFRGESALHRAAEGPERDPNYYHVKDKKQIQAAEAASKKLLLLLIEKGADLNQRDNWECTSLHYAVNLSCIVTLDLLVKHGAKLDLVDCNKNTLLHYIGASKKNVIELTRYLCGINKGNFVRNMINQENALGETPFMSMCHRKFTDHPKDKGEVLKLLLQHGANPDVKTDELNTPLHLGVIIGDNELVSLLLKHKNAPRYINIQDLDGNTPLHCALQSTQDLLSEIKHTGILLEEARQKQGVKLPSTTPAESPQAIRQRIQHYEEALGAKRNLLKSYQDIVKWLLKSGADPDIQNYGLQSARDLAIKLTDPTMRVVQKIQTFLRTSPALEQKNPQKSEEGCRKKLLELLRSDIEFPIVYKRFHSYLSEKDKAYYQSLYEKYKPIYTAIYDLKEFPQRVSKQEMIQELAQAKQAMEDALKLKFELQGISFKKGITEEERQHSQHRLQVAIAKATFFEHIMKRIYDLAKILHLKISLQYYYALHKEELQTKVQQDYEKELKKRQGKPTGPESLSTTTAQVLGSSLSNMLQISSTMSASSGSTTSSTPENEHVNNNNTTTNDSNNNNVNNTNPASDISLV